MPAPKRDPGTSEEIDFGILSVREIRDVLKSKAHCLRAGFPADHVIIKTLNEFRDHYVKRVGMSTYLSQMLGSLGKTEVQYCRMFADNGSEIHLSLNGSHNQPIQRFLARHFRVSELPFKIEISPPDGPSDVRYL